MIYNVTVGVPYRISEDAPVRLLSTYLSKNAEIALDPKTKVSIEMNVFLLKII